MLKQCFKCGNWLDVDGGPGEKAKIVCPICGNENIYYLAKGAQAAPGPETPGVKNRVKFYGQFGQVCEETSDFDDICFMLGSECFEFEVEGRKYSPGSVHGHNHIARVFNKPVNLRSLD